MEKLDKKNKISLKVMNHNQKIENTKTNTF